MNFHDFWTNDNNPKLDHYLYGGRHIALLISVFFVTIALILIFGSSSKKTKRNVMLALASLLVVFEALSRIVNLVIIEDYSIGNIAQTMLPLYFCSVVVWLCIIAIYTDNKMLQEVSCIGGLLATLAFLLYPSVGINRQYMSFTCIYSAISHSTGFITAVLFIAFGIVRFRYKDIWKILLCFVGIFAYGALFEFLIFPDGEDYMFLKEDPLSIGLPFSHLLFYAPILLLYINSFYFISWLVSLIRRSIALKKQPA